MSDPIESTTPKDTPPLPRVRESFIQKQSKRRHWLNSRRNNKEDRSNNDNSDNSGQQPLKGISEEQSMNSGKGEKAMQTYSKQPQPVPEAPVAEYLYGEHGEVEGQGRVTGRGDKNVGDNEHEHQQINYPTVVLPGEGQPHHLRDTIPPHKHLSRHPLPPHHHFQQHEPHHSPHHLRPNTNNHILPVSSSIQAHNFKDQEQHIFTLLSNQGYHIPPTATLTSPSLLLIKNDTHPILVFQALITRLLAEVERISSELSKEDSHETKDDRGDIRSHAEITGEEGDGSGGGGGGGGKREAYAYKEELMLRLLTEVVPGLSHVAESVAMEVGRKIGEQGGGVRLWVGSGGVSEGKGKERGGDEFGGRSGS